MSVLSVQGMELLVDYDYVAIFDADFKPDPDFLVRDYLNNATPCLIALASCTVTA